MSILGRQSQFQIAPFSPDMSKANVAAQLGDLLGAGVRATGSIIGDKMTQQRTEAKAAKDAYDQQARLVGYNISNWAEEVAREADPAKQKSLYDNYFGQLVSPENQAQFHASFVSKSNDIRDALDKSLQNEQELSGLNDANRLTETMRGLLSTQISNIIDPPATPVDQNQALIQSAAATLNLGPSPSQNPVLRNTLAYAVENPLAGGDRLIMGIVNKFASQIPDGPRRKSFIAQATKSLSSQYDEIRQSVREQRRTIYANDAFNGLMQVAQQPNITKSQFGEAMQLYKGIVGDVLAADVPDSIRKSRKEAMMRAADTMIDIAEQTGDERLLDLLTSDKVIPNNLDQFAEISEKIAKARPKVQAKRDSTDIGNLSESLKIGLKNASAPADFDALDQQITQIESLMGDRALLPQWSLAFAGAKADVSAARATSQSKFMDSLDADMKKFDSSSGTSGGAAGIGPEFDEPTALATAAASEATGLVARIGKALENGYIDEPTAKAMASRATSSVERRTQLAQEVTLDAQGKVSPESVSPETMAANWRKMLAPSIVSSPDGTPILDQQGKPVVQVPAQSFATATAELFRKYGNNITKMKSVGDPIFTSMALEPGFTPDAFRRYAETRVEMAKIPGGKQFMDQQYGDSPLNHLAGVMLDSGAANAADIEQVLRSADPTMLTLADPIFSDNAAKLAESYGITGYDANDQFNRFDPGPSIGQYVASKGFTDTYRGAYAYSFLEAMQKGRSAQVAALTADGYASRKLGGKFVSSVPYSVTQIIPAQLTVPTGDQSVTVPLAEYVDADYFRYAVNDALAKLPKEERDYLYWSSWTNLGNLREGSPFDDVYVDFDSAAFKDGKIMAPIVLNRESAAGWFRNRQMEDIGEVEIPQDMVSMARMLQGFRSSQFDSGSFGP